MITFSASLDRLATAFTALFWLALLAGAATLGAFVHPLAGLAELAIAVWVMLLGPRGYAVTDELVVVRRSLSGVSVPLHDVRRVARVSPADVGRQLRVFGSGGAHGYFGKFRSDRLGPLEYQATRRDTLVLLEVDGRAPLVVSPDDPDRFVAAVRGPCRGALAQRDRLLAMLDDTLAEHRERQRPWPGLRRWWRRLLYGGE